MKTSFVCLANSFKEGGRCIAGIELSTSGLPIIQNGEPKWIRPVSNDGHGEVPTHLVSHINILDIVEIDIIDSIPDGFQAENVSFDPNSLRVIGRYSTDQLTNLCNANLQTLFGNRGGAVTPDNALNLNYSLAMIEPVQPQIVEKIYEGSNSPKLRLSFTFNNIRYELPITDPIFLNQYKTNKNILVDKNLLLSISLGVVHENWHSKLVAGIIIK
jgi:hypothetical protein